MTLQKYFKIANQLYQQNLVKELCFANYATGLFSANSICCSFSSYDCLKLIVFDLYQTYSR